MGKELSIADEIENALEELDEFLLGFRREREEETNFTTPECIKKLDEFLSRDDCPEDKNINTKEEDGMMYGIMIQKNIGKVKAVYSNEAKKTTTIIWQDGSTSQATCEKGDKFDVEKGIAMAIAKKAIGSKELQKALAGVVIQKAKTKKTTNKKADAKCKK